MRELLLFAMLAAVLGDQTPDVTAAPPNASYGVVPPAPTAVPPGVATVAAPLYSSLPLLPAGLDAAAANLRAAMQTEQSQWPVCVDYYYQAVVQSWPYLGPRVAAPERALAWNLYHVGLAKLVETGQRFSRHEPSRGLKINTPSGVGYVAIAYEGFVWQPDDFNRLELAGVEGGRPLRHAFVQDGVGVPLLVTRQREANADLIPAQARFAATAVLQPGQTIARGHDVLRTEYEIADAAVPTMATLRFVDPARVDHIVIDGQAVPIARDLSSAVASSLRQTQVSAIDRMFRPGTPDDYDGLRMLEPYQAGKIPIIFVHGLISDRSTWANVTNELRAMPWIHDRYQFWYFQYPTGEPFLSSALTLREQTRAAVQQLDPHGQDSALSQMVLIGHSMGGLVAKLQITHSSTTLWDAHANRPLSEIRGEPQSLDRMWRLFFFEPQPCVKRVIFIGTPHQGSAWASRIAGRFVSGMVQEPADRRQMLRELVAANPGVFSRELQGGIPTSVDLLEPNSPLMLAMARLDIAAGVRMHSIVGLLRTGFGSPSDGVVPVASARHPGTASEYFVDVRHSQLTQAPETMAEVSRILAEHAQEFAPR